MHKIQTYSLSLLFCLISLSPKLGYANNITGAGASFPAPAYAKWADTYYKKTGHQVNYQSIGSGAGIKQIQAKTVDFGATDMPLKEPDLEKNGLIQFPTLIGAVIPVVNITGIQKGQLILNGQLLGDIYLGKITKWNDPAIRALNSSIKLPDQTIQVIHRADASGTSFLFTHYLSQVHKEWQQKIGQGTTVSWPIGAAGKGNEGIAALVQRLPGSIGYVEYAYTRQSRLSYVRLQNAAKQIVSPNDHAFRAATQHVDWKKSTYQILTNAEGKDAWPITGATFILMQKITNKPENSQNALQFFAWSYQYGNDMAAELGYVPLSTDLQKQIRSIWKQIKTTNGKTIYSE